MNWLTLLTAMALGQAGAVEQLAQEVHEQVRPHFQKQSAALYVESAAGGLSEAFSTAFLGRAARQGSWAPLHAQSRAEAEKKAREWGLSGLLRVELTVREGRLWAVGDFFSTWQNFWSGQVPTRAAGPSGLVHASVPTDAHVALLMHAREMANSLSCSNTLFATLPAPPIAMATGNVIADGPLEVAVLTPTHVHLFDARGKALSQWPLSPEVPFGVPVRGPFGALTIDVERRWVGVFLSGHAQGQWLSFDGPPTVVATFSAASVPLGSLGLNGAAIEGQTEFQTQTTPKAVRTVHGKGRPHFFLHPRGRGTWRPAEGQEYALEGLGEASTLVDLDGDQTPELMSSSTHFQKPDDEISVYRLRPTADGPLRPEKLPLLWRSEPLQGAAWVATTGDLEARGKEALLVGLRLENGQGEIRLIQKETP